MKPVFFINCTQEDAILIEPVQKHLLDLGYTVTGNLEGCDYILSFFSQAYLADIDAVLTLTYAACSLQKEYILISAGNAEAYLPPDLEMLAARHGVIPLSRFETGIASRIAMPKKKWRPTTKERRYAIKPFTADEAGFAFVSYAHDDNQLVYPIIEQLYKSGWKLWYDEGIRISERYIADIARHVRGCDAFLLFLTERSVNRPFVVNFELAYAKKLGKPIIPVLAQETVSELPSLIAGLELIKPERIDCLLGKYLSNLGHRKAVPPKDKPGEEYDIQGLLPMPGFDYEVHADGIFIVKYTGKSEKVVVPGEWCGLPVKMHRGSNEMVLGAGELFNFYIPDSVKEIVFSEGIKKIRKIDFDNNLKGKCIVHLPLSLEVFEGFLESGKNLTVIVPSGSYAQEYVNNHVKCITGNYIEGDYALRHNPAGLTIAEYYGNDNQVIIPGAIDGAKVTSIGIFAFYNKGLDSVVIPNGVTAIGDGAFSHNSFDNVRIPDSVKSIGDESFCGCENLREIVSNAELSRIGGKAFYDCAQLKDIIINTSCLEEVGEYAFHNTEWLNLQPFGSVYLGKIYYTYRYNTTRGNHIIGIPSLIDIVPGTTGIADKAFAESAITKRLTQIAMPDTIEFIGNQAFSGCVRLTRVILPDSVRRVGNYCFENCDRLKTVSFPKGLKQIPEGMFWGCAILSEVSLPDRLEEINAHAFHRCALLAEIRIPDSVTKIDDKAFFGCAWLSRITLPDKAIDIGEDVFKNTPWYYGHIKSQMIYIGNIFYLRYNDSEPQGENGIGDNIEILPGTKAIAGYAFDNGGFSPYSGSNIDTVKLPAGLEIIGKWAFSRANFRSFELPQGIKNINSYAFYKCTKLTRAVIPEGTKTIGDSAYEGCSALREVYIPESVENIGKEAFEDCPSLKAFVCAENSYAHGYAVKNRLPLRLMERDGAAPQPVELEREDNKREDDKGFALLCSSEADYDTGRITSKLYEDGYFIEKDPVNLEDCRLILILFSAPLLNDNAAMRNIRKVTGLRKLIVTVYAGVTPDSLPKDMQISVGQIEGVIWDFGEGEQECYKRLCGMLQKSGCYENPFDDFQYTVNGDQISLKKYRGNKKTLYVPGRYPDSAKTVTDIDEAAFSGCLSLIEVVLPRSVNYISEKIFRGCTSLKKVTIPPGVTRIGSSTFDKCANLESAEIPAGVTLIDSWAFMGCASLKKIDIPGSVTRIGQSAFEGCTALRHIGFSGGLTRIGKEAFKETAWLKEHPEGEIYAGGLFLGFSGEMPPGAAIRLREGTSGFADEALSQQIMLKTIYIPASCTEISREAFDGLHSLERIDVAPGNPAFSSIDGVWFTRDKSMILKYPPAKPSSSYIIPDGVTAVYAGAFWGCKKLRKITIPKGVISIWQLAFADSGLLEIEIPDTVKSMDINAFNGCKALTRVHIGKGLERISYRSFKGCRALKSITIPDSVTKIDSDAFSDCSGNFTLITPKGSFAAEWAKKQWDKKIKCETR